MPDFPWQEFHARIVRLERDMPKVYPDNLWILTAGGGIALFIQPVPPECRTDSFRDMLASAIPIPQDVRDLWLQHKLKEAYASARAWCPSLPTLSPNRQMVVADLCYNAGSLKGSPRFLDAIARQDWEGAVAEMDVHLARGQENAKLMLEG